MIYSLWIFIISIRSMAFCELSGWLVWAHSRDLTPSYFPPVICSNFLPCVQALLLGLKISLDCPRPLSPPPFVCLEDVPVPSDVQVSFFPSLFSLSLLPLSSLLLFCFSTFSFLFSSLIPSQSPFWFLYPWVPASRCGVCAPHPILFSLLLGAHLAVWTPKGLGDPLCPPQPRRIGNFHSFPGIIPPYTAADIASCLWC